MTVAFHAARASSNGSGGTAVTMRMPGAYAIALRAAQGSNNGSGGTSITMTFPTGLTAGDVMLMAVTARGGSGTTISDPTGWTPLGSQVNSGTALAQKVYWKVATSGDVSDGSVAVTITSAKASGVVIAFLDVDPSAPASAQYDGQANSSSATVTAPSLTCSGVGVEVVFSGTAYGSTCTPVTLTEPANGESASSGGGANSRTTSEVEYGAFSGSNPPSRTATMADAAVNIGHHIFLAQASGTSVSDGDVLIANVAAVGGSLNLIRLPSGMTFTLRATLSFAGAIAYDGTNALWIVAGSGGGLATASDPTGTWTDRTSSFGATYINDVASDGGVSVAVGDSGKIARSTNATSWGQQTNPFGATEHVTAVAHGNGVWAAVGGLSASPRIATSSDGITWTNHDIAAVDWLISVATDGAGTWAAGGQSNDIWRSTNGGATWAAAASGPSGGSVRGIAYGAGVWVAVMNDGSMYHSSDADTWTAVDWNPYTSGMEIQLTKVVFGGGVFVASNYYRSVTTSTDGLTWSDPEDTPWSANVSVGLGYGAGMWTASGSSNRIATAPAPTMSAVWRHIGSVDSGTSLKSNLYWKVAASEPTSYTVGIGASNAASAVIVAASGAASARPPAAAIAGQANASSTTLTAPALGSWSATNGLDLALFGVATATSVSPPTNYTEPAGAESSSSGTTSDGSYRALSSVTTVGSLTGTAGSAAVNIGFHVFLAEAIGAFVRSMTDAIDWITEAVNIPPPEPPPSPPAPPGRPIEGIWGRAQVINAR